MLSCDVCEAEFTIITVRKVLTCFTNILLSDYTTSKVIMYQVQRLIKVYPHFLNVIIPRTHMMISITLCNLNWINMILSDLLDVREGVDSLYYLTD